MIKFDYLANSSVEVRQTVCKRIEIKMLEFNLFKSSRMNIDPFQCRSLKISSWIYIILLFLSIIILSIFICLDISIENKIIKNPSLNSIKYLQKEYSSSIKCPCNQISIRHNTFISILPEFHPICKSLLISDEWINALSIPSSYSRRDLSNDIFLEGSKFFLTLKSFCIMRKTIVLDELFIFNQSLLINNELLTENELIY